MPEILAEDQYAEWDAFVKQAKGGTIFHMSWYLQTLANDLEVRVLRDDSGQIEAGMAVTPIGFLGTKSARRPQWTPYNGPLILPSSKEKLPENISEEKNRLLRILAESPRMGMYDYNLPPQYTDLMPFLWNGFDTSVGYTYQIAPVSTEQLRQAMSRNNWKNLRRARNAMKEINGVIEVNGDVGEFFGMLMELKETNRFPVRNCDLERFSRWWECVRQRDAGTLYILRDGEGRAMTGNVAVHDWNCMYAIVGGVYGGRLSGPAGYLHRLLFERMITDAHRRNQTFDFEGSVHPGIEPYFRGWGGRCVPKYRVVKILRSWSYAAWCLHRYLTRHRKKAWFSP